MRRRRWAISASLLTSLMFASAARGEDAAGPFATAIDAARQRVVKLYGGGFGSERGFGSGVLVSADGRIVTTNSVLLESAALRAVLPDGRRFPARVIRRDESRQLALLKVDAEGLAFFEPRESARLRPGDWLIAAANPFKVADGPEPISVMAGTFAGRTELSARRHAQDFSYQGPVLITDVIIATPGSAGGALVDIDGKFVGLIGKAVISNRTNTWINYAMPAEEVAAFLNEEDAAAEQSPETRQPRADRRDPDLGIRLFDVGGRTRPAYIERVRPGSPAQLAGLRPDDLVLSIDGAAVATCGEFRSAQRRLRPGDEITLVVKRGEELKSVQVTVGSRQR